MPAVHELWFTKERYLADIRRYAFLFRNKSFRAGEGRVYFDFVYSFDLRLRLHMRMKDLYLIAFENNKNEVFYTGDCGLPKDNNRFIFVDKGDYRSLQFVDDESKENDLKLSWQKIEGNIYTLHKHRDGGKLKEVWKAFASMCVVVSEAIRFNKLIGEDLIYTKVLNYQDVTPAEILEVAQDWASRSKGKHPNGVTCSNVKNLNYFNNGVGFRWDGPSIPNPSSQSDRLREVPEFWVNPPFNIENNS
ncbi:ribosome-inactivating family protein [Microbulbifer sp. JMSA002]|uniref:ribosome-inactivating family protein n=1 Tax=Microbulbifer sp. JMSA002 TaxID=3243368 RepID=UPI00403A61E0